MLYQFADYFGVDASSLAIVKHRCQESLLGEQLKNLLQDICPIIPQLTVDRYRVDFYLPAISVVIEYDEQHHKHQSKEDLQRQNYIEDRLGCTFIRVQSGYDFSLIANKIMIALLKSKR
jgi:very-short-patch-repair endonuclease